MKPTQQLHDLGQSLWLDNITRDMLDKGTLKRYIDEFSITGLTSNPTIFDHAISKSGWYDASIRQLVGQGLSGENLFFELAIQDLSRAADLFDLTEAPTSSRINIGVFADGRLTFLRLKNGLDLQGLMPDLSEKQRSLDVVILHRLVLEKCLGITEEAVKKESYITYYREREAALKTVREGKAQIAFLLNATRLDQLRDIAFEGNVMPQKSTDFYPKVLSGLTMYALE